MEMDPQERQEEFSTKDEGLRKDDSYNDTDNQSLETEEPVGETEPSQDVSAEDPKPSDPSPVPNGGLQAWLHVVAGFLLFFNTWGLLNAFGVFQTYYESGALFTESSSNISWIGSLQSFMLMTVGFFSGPLYDKGHLRILLIVGSFGIVFGHMMLSLCTTYWQVLLAQGFCVGMGAGCLFVPCVSILPTYFNTKIGLVLGLAASGSSFGGVIYPIVLYRLIDRIGFSWSVRVIGFIAMGTLIFPIVVMKMRVKSTQSRALIDFSAFTDLPYMLFTISTMIGFMGLYVLLFYLSFFGEDHQITDTKLAFYLVPIFNAASCFGRTLPNALSDKTGPFNMIAPGAAVVGILVLCINAIKNVAGIVIMAILSGFFSGVFISMPPVCFVALTKDKSKIGTRMGMGFSIIALGVLAGGPGGGAILGKVAPLKWHSLWVFGGVTPLVAATSYVILRVQRSGFKLKVKA